MKEINIASVLQQKRKEKGITQDDLANYIGVSKASVSKWETGQSYPDITFLPQLAAYFNISIDDLMDYKPQMTKEDIRILYRRLAADFAAKPFDDVLSECREIIKKYFVCFPLVLQMGILILNHSMLVKDPERTAALIGEIKELFIRVKKESEDVDLCKQALFLEAYCCIALGDAISAMNLLEGTTAPYQSGEVLLSSAYQMVGKTEEAKATLQVGIYQHVVTLLGILPSYLLLVADDPERFEEALRRIVVVRDGFQIEKLHPSLLFNLYIAAAQGYLAQGNRERALDLLEEYEELGTGDIYPLKLQGDDFFHLIDPWLAEFDLGTGLPRDEKTIKESMVEVLTANPVFAALHEDIRYQKIAARLKKIC